MTQYEALIDELKSLANPDDAAGKASFGISSASTEILGIRIPLLRKLAKRTGKDHALAEQLWDSRIHEGRILATMIDDPAQVTPDQMERWAADFDSWDLCDQCCGNLFDKTPFAVEKVHAWSQREEEFVKRAAFALIAWMAVHDKQGPDSLFESFLPFIKREATDERNFVKKAVNWALRQIGKRNDYLLDAALTTAYEIAEIDSKAARWVARDAIRELEKRTSLAQNQEKD